MTKNLYFLLLVCVSATLSCKHNSQRVAWRTTEDSIAIEKTLLNRTSRFKNISNKNFLQSYNRETNEILLVDINSSKTIFKVVPQINFSDDSIGRFIQFDIYKPDSTFIITENRVFIINSIGEIIYNKNLNIPVKDRGVEVVFWDNDNQFPLYYDSLKKELLLRAMCNCYYMESKYFQRKVEATLNLGTGEIAFLNYSFPRRYLEHSYGQAVFPFREVNGPLNVISFQNEDSLYVFNRETNHLAAFTCKSSYQGIDFIPFDTSYQDDIERIKEHLTVSPMYQKIIFDKFRNVYYRFFIKEQPLKNSSGIYHGLFDRDIIIMVLTKDFKIISEKNIGNSYLWYYSFVSEKGLHIRKYVKDKLINTDEKYQYFTIFSWN